jgi:hypothetical protein
MSKKLIAVASAAALALTALVGVAPASANVVVAVDGTNGADSGAGTSASPYLESVPAANLIDDISSIEFDVTTVVGQVLTVTATGAVRVLDVVTGATAGTLYTSASGSTTYTETADATTTSFVVYNTSTTAGTIQISLKSATTSATGDLIHIKGVAAAPYNYTVTVPASIASGATGEITATVTDLFGNALEANATAITDLQSATAAGLSAPTLGAVVTWDSTRKVYYQSVTAQATAAPWSYTLALSKTDIGGLAKAKDTHFAAVNSPAAAAANATATAQIAALTAQLAASRPIATSVTKKKYNTLARKWNAAFPSQKVALKK